MLKRRLALACGGQWIAAVALAASSGCATGTGSSGFTNGNGGGNGGGGGSNNNSTLGGGNSGTLGSVSQSSASDGGRAPRCNDAGKCTCFNVASLGYGGATGAQFGTNAGGTDNTAAFVNYMNTASSALFAQLGCGQDTGCTSPDKPTLTADFLSQYDVIIFQWMTNSLTEVLSDGKPVGFEGNTYWNFSSDELSALKTWVMGGGGVIVLSGYDYSSGEIAPANQVLGALTDIQYTADDTFGDTEMGNAELCLGDTDPVVGWAQNTALGEGVTEVGAFHGRHITNGTASVVDCDDTSFVATGGATTEGGVCAVHQDVGMGHVYAYTDEWVTYTSQWNPPTPPAPYCLADASAAGTNGDYPSVQEAYQVPQFWENAIAYASQATMCQFTLQGTQPR